MQIPRIFTIGFFVVLLVALTPIADARNLHYVVTYGDSLSDNGNLYAAVGYPPPPYWNGRASNGPVAVEYVSQAMGVPLLDFAWFGATSGVGNDVDGGNQTALGSHGLPGMLAQLAATKGKVAPIAGKSLVVVWGGANDFLTNGFSQATAKAAVSDIVAIVKQLQGIGVTHIVVPGMPDIGLTPDYRGNQGASALCRYFNHLLLAELPEGATYVDTFSLMHEVVGEPSDYGFTNVTDPCFNGVDVCSNPDQYLFWDGFHPTTRGHQVIAEAIEQAARPGHRACSGLAACSAGQ